MGNYFVLKEYIEVLFGSLTSAVVALAIYKYGVKTERRFFIYEKYLFLISKIIQQDKTEENLTILVDIERSIPSKYVSKKLRRNLNGIISSYTSILKADLEFLNTDSRLLVGNYVQLLIKEGLLDKQYVMDYSKGEVKVFIDELAMVLKKYAYDYIKDEKNFLQTIFKYLCNNSNRLFDVTFTDNIASLLKISIDDFKPLNKYQTLEELFTRTYYCDNVCSFNMYQQKLIKEIEKYY